MPAEIYPLGRAEPVCLLFDKGLGFSKKFWKIICGVGVACGFLLVSPAVVFS